MKNIKAYKNYPFFIIQNEPGSLSGCRFNIEHLSASSLK